MIYFILIKHGNKLVPPVQELKMFLFFYPLLYLFLHSISLNDSGLQEKGLDWKPQLVVTFGYVHSSVGERPPSKSSRTAIFKVLVCERIWKCFVLMLYYKRSVADFLISMLCIIIKINSFCYIFICAFFI